MLIKCISDIMRIGEVVLQRRGIMPKKILYAKACLEDEERNIFCMDMDKTDYDSKYKGHLKCVNDCDARVKFTQRKNNIKFYSTWNKEGRLHGQWCPYYVEYKGVKGREKLNAYFKSIELDDDTIFRRIKRKFDDMHRNYSAEELPTPDRGSANVENTGEETVDTGINSLSGEESTNSSYIHHKDAKLVTADDLKSIISVYGVIDNVWIDVNKDGTKFAYINYVTENTSVNILFSEVFYNNEYLSDMDEFERFILKVQKMVNDSETPIEAIAYGEITPKKRRQSGVNVSVNNPKRILINGMSYKQILYGDIK